MSEQPQTFEQAVRRFFLVNTAVSFGGIMELVGATLDRNLQIALYCFAVALPLSSLGYLITDFEGVFEAVNKNTVISHIFGYTLTVPYVGIAAIINHSSFLSFVIFSISSLTSILIFFFIVKPVIVKTTKGQSSSKT
jgi:hypothetical protein